MGGGDGGGGEGLFAISTIFKPPGRGQHSKVDRALVLLSSVMQFRLYQPVESVTNPAGMSAA